MLIVQIEPHKHFIPKSYGTLIIIKLKLIFSTKLVKVNNKAKKSDFLCIFRHCVGFMAVISVW